LKKEESVNVSGNIFDIKNLSKLFKYIRPYRSYFTLLIILTFTASLLGPLKPYLIRITVDDKILTGDLPGLYWMTGALVILLLVHGLMQYFTTYLAAWLGQNIIKDIRIKLYQHLIKFKLGFFDKTPIGRLVTRNISDIEALSNVFSEGFAGIAGDLLQIIIILAFMFNENWRLTLLSLSTIPLLLFATYIFKEKVKSSFNQARTAVSNLNSFVQEHITGMSIVQIFNSEEREYEKFKVLNDEHRKAYLRSVLYYSVYFPIAEFIAASGTVLLIWFGAGEVISGYATPGTLIAFIMYISMFFRPIRMIADRFNTLQMAVVSAERIFNLLEEEKELMKNGTYIPAKIEGRIEFKNVWFAYQDENYVLKNISFEINPGESLAFVGATGAGKTSVVNLLNRFYDIQKGEILLDGKNIADYELGSLRAGIGLVLQDVFLFSDSILNNITLNNPAITEEKVWEAIDMVGARKFIEKLPNQLHYNVMERGATLSVGQRQLISFIRCLVYNPRIIILDEATSSIDSETEELIQAAIDKLMKGRTSIVIAHRLSTIQKASKIIVLDKGEIKESGTHESLLNLDGFYTQLNKLQYKQAI
jgi:ATP-binding cassette, subfamily B, multidrug efflux pump